MGMSSAVIGSGEHMSVVAMADNVSGIRKDFMKLFINGIFVVQANPTLHTLEPRSSHVESDPDVQRYLRHTCTDTQTEIPCFYREI